MLCSKCCPDRKSTRLNSSHLVISYAVFCLKKKNKNDTIHLLTEIQAAHERYRATLSASVHECVVTQVVTVSAVRALCLLLFFFFFLRKGRPPNSPFFPPPPLSR